MKKLGSWKTTLLGILAGVGGLITELTALLDDDPLTVFSVTKALGYLGVMGVGFLARDNNKTSEEVGANVRR